MEELRNVIVSTLVYPGWLTKTLNQVKVNLADGLDNKYIKSILGVYAMVCHVRGQILTRGGVPDTGGRYMPPGARCLTYLAL